MSVAKSMQSGTHPQLSDDFASHSHSFDNTDPQRESWPPINSERARLPHLLELILDSIGDGVTVEGRDGALVYANSVAAKSCGFESSEDMVRADHEVFFARFEFADEDGRVFTRHELPSRRALRGLDTPSLVLRITERATGHVRWAHLTTNVVLACDGQPEIAINIWRDVTAARRRRSGARLLGEVSASTYGAADASEMLSGVAELLVPRFGDWCAIDLIEGDALRPVALAHPDPSKAAIARRLRERHSPDWKSGNGIGGVVRSGRGLLFPTRDAGGEESPQQLLFLRALKMRSAMA
ncbi:MAG TPA: PAS domain S-box protein, partial [Polyangiaceae bacterium]|nr:PAS domain S-box protein [Polyangiaceae bacterium]